MANTTDILRRITALAQSEAKLRGNRRTGDNAQRLGFQRTTLSSQQAMHRLKIGGTGVGLMLLLVGLASVINDRARMADEQSVPEAVATVEPIANPTESNDPLVDAGVVPDLPAKPANSGPQQEPAIVPESPPSSPAGAPGTSGSSQ